MIDPLQQNFRPANSGVWKRFRADPRGLCGLCGIAALIAVAVFSPLLANRLPLVCWHNGTLYFPAVVDAVHNLPGGRLLLVQQRPFRYPGFDPRRDLSPDDFALFPPLRLGPRQTSADILVAPQKGHLLGTDQVGRDVAARLLHGACVSLGVGIGAMILATAIGVTLGAVGGYLGGVPDALICRLVEVVICFPVFFLLLTVMAWVGPGTGAAGLILILGLTRWTSIARYARAEFLRLKVHPYVDAARALGAGPARIIIAHILPGALTPVLIAAAYGTANVILIEAGLSWLGFGVSPPTPTWGAMLRSGYENLDRAPHLIYASGAAILLTVLACNQVAEALRRATNPRES